MDFQRGYDESTLIDLAQLFGKKVSVDSPTQTVTLWPLAVYFVAVIVIAASMLGFSYLLGQRHHDQATGEPYESGIVSTGSARMRFDAKFYLNAMFFVVFDLESVFIVAWAVALHSAGWGGYIVMSIFIGVILVTLIYLWRAGALDWSPLGRRGRAATRATGDRSAVVPTQPNSAFEDAARIGRVSTRAE